MTRPVVAFVCNYFAHTYNYSALILGREEPSVTKLWSQITDLPLVRIVVAGSELVHRQTDSVSCGVFVCIYAKGLVRAFATNTEEPTRDSPLFARQHVSH